MNKKRKEKRKKKSLIFKNFIAFFTSDNSVGRLVYNWYASCMDQEERNNLKAEPLKELLHLVNGPSLDDSILASEEDPPLILEDVLAFVHRNLSIFPLFTLSLNNDPRNSSSPTHLSVSRKQTDL